MAAKRTKKRATRKSAKKSIKRSAKAGSASSSVIKRLTRVENIIEKSGMNSLYGGEK
jgi:hypothetical protein